MADSFKTVADSQRAVDKQPNIVHSLTLKWWHGWAPMIIFPGSVLAFFPVAWPRWGFMWTLAVAIYAGCKWLSWRRTLVPGAPLWRHAGYLLAWPGMDAAAFLNSSSNSKLSPCCPGEWFFALAKLAGGILLFWGVARIVPQQYPLVVGWIGMIGIVMTLHFGLFHLLSCGWRTIGVDARPLMNSPLISNSISEFWGLRWNAAFRDLTHRFLFRPLIPKFGAPGTIFIVFLFSGLIHDLVISLPAWGGYGGPTAFFLIQGSAILWSRSAIGRRIGLRNGLLGWAFMILVLLLSMFLLFQPVFVEAVIVPFMKAMEAI